MKLLCALLLVLTLRPTALCAEEKQDFFGGIFGRSRMKSVLGQDGVSPVEVRAGNGFRAFLWTFGDTILGSWKGDVSAAETFNFNAMTSMDAMLPNSLAVTVPPDERNYGNLEFRFLSENGRPAQFIKYGEGENPFLVRYWANGGIQSGADVYVYFMAVSVDREKKPLPFTFTHTGLAKWTVSSDWKGELSRIDFKRIASFRLDGIAAGDSAILKDGWVYLAGRIGEGGGTDLINLCLLRVRPADIENAEKYEVLSGAGWGKKRQGYFGDVAGEASIRYDAGHGGFRIVYLGAGEQAVVRLTCGELKGFPEGCSREIIHTPPRRANQLYYSAKEIFSSGGKMYGIYIDPAIYQPILFRAPLPAAPKKKGA